MDPEAPSSPWGTRPPLRQANPASSCWVQPLLKPPCLRGDVSPAPPAPSPLVRHYMESHEPPYRCDECEYRTNRADALRVHKETRHQEARSFICEQCGKAFKTRFLLKTHLKKHSEEKPYVCNVCGRAFRWAAGLRHHYLTHTNEHPFFCRYCPYKAKQKFQVIKHIQRHHPERGAGDPSQGVGKDPSTPTVHLHAVQRERRAEGPPGFEEERGCQILAALRARWHRPAAEMYVLWLTAASPAPSSSHSPGLMLAKARVNWPTKSFLEVLS
uniref:C2H2-type domain-containing protein n=1 Tax=Strigops habroptila TaxID=2489341 RepID=A0A672UIV1_STRHB